jgi:hypothetical protein
LGFAQSWHTAGASLPALASSVAALASLDALVSARALASTVVLATKQTSFGYAPFFFRLPGLRDAAKVASACGNDQGNQPRFLFNRG